MCFKKNIVAPYKYIFIFFLGIFLSSCGPSKEDTFLKSLEYYHVQSGTRGPVAWKLEAEQKEGSIDLFINICTDFKEKKLNRAFLVTCKDTTEARRARANFARAVFKGDRCVLVLPTNSYRALNIYTGEVLESEKEITQKFPQLKDGVSAVDYYGDSYNMVAVKDVDGKQYYYDNNQTLLFNELQKYWVDSLVNRESGGFVNKTAGDGERFYAFPGFACKVMLTERGSMFSTNSGFAYKPLPMNFHKKLGEIKNKSEIMFLDFNCNNSVLWMYSNGKRKFAYGVNLSEGKPIADLDLDTLFTFEESK